MEQLKVLVATVVIAVLYPFIVNVILCIAIKKDAGESAECPPPPSQPDWRLRSRKYM